MLLALDHDGTYTLDPEFWQQVVELAQARGHGVVCVSGRDDTAANREALQANLPPGLPLLLCNHRVKKAVAREHKLHVDVWIDDFPEGVVAEAAGCS